MRSLFFGAVLAALLSGCLATFPIPGGKEGQAKYVFQGDDIEVLGPVSVQGEVVVLLGYFALGTKDLGYIPLVQKARMNLGADTVIDVVVDRHYLGFLGPVFGRMQWRATGTAIRYHERLRATSVERTALAPVATTESSEAVMASSVTPQTAPKPAHSHSGPSAGAEMDQVGKSGERERATHNTAFRLGFARATAGLRAASAMPH